MTCRDALEILAEYLDGSLPFRQRLSLDFHLSLCRHCRDYLENYRKTILATRDAYGDQALFEEIPEELVQAILSTQKLRPRVDDSVAE